ncbi:MAG: YbaK/EbsC family protein [Clostridiaceae bacterium]
MHIDMLSFRTIKGDNLLKEHTVENLLIRGGFVQKIKGKTCYTETGVMLNEKIEAVIKSCLQQEGFHAIRLEQSQNMREARQELFDYTSNSVVSYKDIPLKLHLFDQLKMNVGNRDSIWCSEYQRILQLASLGTNEGGLKKTMESIFVRLGIPTELRGLEFYFQKNEGKDSYSTDENSLEKSNEDSDGNASNADVESKLIYTPSIKSIVALEKFLNCKGSDILKTMLFSYGDKVCAVLLPGHLDVDLRKVEKVLDLYEGGLKPASEELIQKVTGTTAGFIGPVGIKVDKVLIDQDLNKKKNYYAGANKTDYHFSGLRYGRDFTGDFDDVAARGEETKGWLLGVVKSWPEKVRVQNLEGAFSYFTLEMGFINLERVMLAMAEARLDEIGISFGNEFGLFEAVISIVDIRDENSIKTAEALYELLCREGIKVLYDDRKDRMGSKFKDYDLLGIEKRIIIGKNSRDILEIKNRNGAISYGNMGNIVEIIRG